MMLKTFAVVAAAMLFVTLSHIARGVRLLTPIDAWLSRAMAGGIEAAYIVGESAMTCAATGDVRRQVVR